MFPDCIHTFHYNQENVVPHQNVIDAKIHEYRAMIRGCNFNSAKFLNYVTHRKKWRLFYFKDHFMRRKLNHTTPTPTRQTRISCSHGRYQNYGQSRIFQSILVWIIDYIYGISKVTISLHILILLLYVPYNELWFVAYYGCQNNHNFPSLSHLAIWTTDTLHRADSM